MDNDSFREWERDFLHKTEFAPIIATNCALFLTRGHIFLDHNHCSEAVESYYNALKCDPSDEAAYSSLVAFYEGGNDLARSMEIIIQAFRAGIGILSDVDFRKYPQELLDKLKDGILEE